MEHNGADKIRDLASQWGERAGAAKDQASEAAHRTAVKLGEQMKTAAGRVRETGPRIEAAVHTTAESLAEKLERGGEYFRERRYEDLVGNASRYIREHPVASLVAGVVTGLFLARKIRR